MAKKLYFFLLLSTVAICSAHGDWEIVNTVTKGHAHITASTNYLWSVNSAHEIYRCVRPCTGKWVRVDGSLMQIDASDDEVWGVNKAHQIFKRPVDGSGRWTRVGGGLKHVSASGNGYIWGVNKHDHIYRCKKPCSGQWIKLDGRLKQVDAGYAYVYGVHSGGTAYARPVDGSGGWRHIPGVRMQHITGSGKDDIFASTAQGDVYRCKKPCVGQWEKMPTNYNKLTQCDASFDAIFGVNSGGSIYRHSTGK